MNSENFVSKFFIYLAIILNKNILFENLKLFRIVYYLNNNIKIKFLADLVYIDKNVKHAGLKDFWRQAETFPDRREWRVLLRWVRGTQKLIYKILPNIYFLISF